MKPSTSLLKRILCLALVLCLAIPLLASCGSSTPNASDAEGKLSGEAISWSYKKESKTLTLTGTGAIESFDVNGGIDAPWAAARLSAEKIVVEEGITSIGAYAFWGMNNVTSATLPHSLTVIGDFAFAYCGSLGAINFPAGLTAIGNSAFEGCGALDSIFLSGATTSIGAYAFAYCYGMKSALITAEPVAGKLLIGAHAFENCRSLSNLVLRTSVTEASVGEDAFKNAAKSLESANRNDNADGVSTYTVHVVVDGVETKTYTETRAYGESKAILPESMEGYTVSPASMEGNGNGANADVTFTYTKIVEEAPAETEGEAVTEPTEDEPKGSNTKAIIAIAVMVVILVAIVIGAVLLFRSDKKNAPKPGAPKNQKK